jgi:hypothetical protein
VCLFFFHFYLCIFVLQCVLCACLCFVYVFLHSVCGFFSCSLLYVLACLLCACVCVCVYLPVFHLCVDTVCVFSVFICRLCLCLSCLCMLMHMCIHMFAHNIIDVCTNVSVLSVIFIFVLCAYFFSYSLRIPFFSVISHFLFPHPCWTLSLSFFPSRCLSLCLYLCQTASLSICFLLPTLDITLLSFPLDFSPLTAFLFVYLSLCLLRTCAHFLSRSVLFTYSPSPYPSLSIYLSFSLSPPPSLHPPCSVFCSFT